MCSIYKDIINFSASGPFRGFDEKVINDFVISNSGIFFGIVFVHSNNVSVLFLFIYIKSSDLDEDVRPPETDVHLRSDFLYTTNITVFLQSIQQDIGKIPKQLKNSKIQKKNEFQTKLIYLWKKSLKEGYKKSPIKYISIIRP